MKENLLLVKKGLGYQLETAQKVICSDCSHWHALRSTILTVLTREAYSLLINIRQLRVCIRSVWYIRHGPACFINYDTKNDISVRLKSVRSLSEEMHVMTGCRPPRNVSFSLFARVSKDKTSRSAHHICRPPVVELTCVSLSPMMGAGHLRLMRSSTAQHADLQVPARSPGRWLSQRRTS